MFWYSIQNTLDLKTYKSAENIFYRMKYEQAAWRRKMEVKYIIPQIKSIKYSISINTVCIGWIILGKKLLDQEKYY